MTTARPAFGGIGPSQVDPRTGEILDADIGIDPTRAAQPPDPARRAGAAADRAVRQPRARRSARSTTSRRTELGFALDLLEARGDIEPDSPEAEAFVLDDLKDVVMHEVGHTLGLRHNFRASTIYTQAQLNDPEFTKAQRHLRLGDGVQRDQHRAARASGRASYAMGTLGPYDYWAIEYGYKPIAAGAGGRRARSASPRATPSRSSPSPPTRTRRRRSTRTPSMGDLGDDPLGFVRAPRHARAGAVGPLAGPAAEARRELLGAAPEHRPRPVAGRRVEPDRREVRRRRSPSCAITPASPRAAALPDRRRSASARRSTMLADGPVLVRQLPLQAGVHAAR